MSAISESNARKKDLLMSNLQFPRTEMVHFTSLLFTDYERKAVPDLRAKRLEPSKDIPKGAIILPIPANLQEVFSVNYQGAELGNLGAAASIMNETGSGKSLGDSGLNLSNIGKKIAATVTGALGSDATRVGERYFGEIFNPHLTTVFTGVQLRNHQFSWRLSPVDQEESMALKNIIDSIRRHMLPPRKDSLILGYPSECFITFYGDGYGIYPTFKSVVTNITVNHAASGAPVFFGTTGMPAEIELTISFQETEVVTRNDVPVPEEFKYTNLTDTEGSF